MSASSGSNRPHVNTTYYEHAVALHRRYPDVPLPREGQPYPDGDIGPTRPGDDREFDTRGVRTAELITAFFGKPFAERDIAELCRRADDYNIPIHRLPAVTEAINLVNPQDARALGRQLARTGTSKSSTVLGMSLLAEVGTSEDVSLIRTIGLLSNTFGALAAKALARLPDAVTNLIWLTDRSAGWGRKYLVEEICALGDPTAQVWLLRKPCDGDFLDGYFAFKVTQAAPVHEALAADVVDEELVDHTGRLLAALVHCEGMGYTIEHYAHAEQVLTDFLTHTARLAPTMSRYFRAWVLAGFVNSDGHPAPMTWSSLNDLRAGFRSLVIAPSWLDVVEAATGSDQDWERRWASRILGELGRDKVHGDRRRPEVACGASVDIGLADIGLSAEVGD